MSSALHSAVLGRQLLEGLQGGSHAPLPAVALTADDGVLLEAGIILHRCSAPCRRATALYFPTAAVNSRLAAPCMQTVAYAGEVGGLYGVW